jgi:hypothetical protein
MKKYIPVIIIACLAFSGTALAANCQKALPHVYEARQEVINNFKKGDHESLEAAIGELLFWDAYTQTECSQAGVEITPIRWLSDQGKGKMSPYLAAFLFWLEEVKQDYGIDITPAGLVRGRTFE